MINDPVFIIENALTITRLMYDQSIFLNIIMDAENNNASDNFKFEQDQYKKLLFEYLKIANKNVSKKYLQRNLLITEYTTLLEKKTCVISNIKYDDEVNIKSLALKPKTRIDAATINEDELTKLIKKLFLMLNNSLDNYNYIKEEIEKSDMTMYFDPSFIDHIIKECQLFIYTFEFFVKNDPFTPTYVYCISHDLTLLTEENTECLYSMSHPVSSIFDHYNKKSAEECHELLFIFDNVINPQKMETIKEECFKCTQNFIDWNVELVSTLVHKQYYSTMIPLLYDHILREVKYYKYLLESVSK